MNSSGEPCKRYRSISDNSTGQSTIRQRELLLYFRLSIKVLKRVDAHEHRRTDFRRFSSPYQANLLCLCLSDRVEDCESDHV